MTLKFKQSVRAVFLILTVAGLFAAPVAYGDGSISVVPSASRRAGVNLKHFNYLLSPVVVKTRKMAIVHIYSDYPDYNYVAAAGEGFACVDDAARAIIMLAAVWKGHHDNKILSRIRQLVEFILYMQNNNGYFNNFVWSDMSINTRYRTSVAAMNWWSFRALWSLEVAHKLFRADGDFIKRIDQATDRVVANIKRDMPVTDMKTRVVNGVKVPNWLPNGSAADQAALAIIALLPHYNRQQDAGVLKIITRLAKGIMQMQKGDATHYPYGMFLSWKNNWHAWGNNQAYALLLAGQQLSRPEYIRSALREIDNFYPYLIKDGYGASLSIKREAGHYVPVDKKRFPQIAYGIRPMIYAVSAAYRLTGNKKYAELLVTLRSWFSGNNIAGRVMYNRKSGMTYDGIISATKINMNSGAESTIEGLMAVQR